MSNTDNSGFAKFVPGFEFLQSLTKGASGGLPQMPSLANWVAPSLNVEELDKRITELKAVHFWLDQNTKALSATIQALEVQKMTLATLKGMNFDLAEVANALKIKPIEPVAPPASPAPAPATAQEQDETEEADEPEAPPPQASRAGKAAGASAKPAQARTAEGGASGLVDPLQLWGALTQQFQQIAATALKDVGKGHPLAASQAAQPVKASRAKPAAKPPVKKAAAKKATASARSKG